LCVTLLDLDSFDRVDPIQINAARLTHVIEERLQGLMMELQRTIAEWFRCVYPSALPDAAQKAPDLVASDLSDIINAIRFAPESEWG
jgi:hypothetical protein